MIPPRIIKYCLIMVIPSFCGAHILADIVTLAWDPAPVPSLAGYNLYYGTVTGAYAQKIAVGNSISVSVPNLTEGWTYFFAVTAYNALGAESAPSSEISFTVPFSTGGHNKNSNRSDEDQPHRQPQQHHRGSRSPHAATTPGLTPKTTRLLKHGNAIDHRDSLHGASIEAAAYARWCRDYKAEAVSTH